MKNQLTLEAINDDVKKNLEAIREEIALTKKQIAAVSEQAAIDRQRIEKELDERTKVYAEDEMHWKDVQELPKSFNRLFVPVDYIWDGTEMDKAKLDRLQAEIEEELIFNQASTTNAITSTKPTKEASHEQQKQDFVDEHEQFLSSGKPDPRFLDPVPASSSKTTEVLEPLPVQQAIKKNQAHQVLPDPYKAVLSADGTLVLRMQNVEVLGIIVRKVDGRMVEGMMIPRMIVRGFRVVVEVCHNS